MTIGVDVVEVARVAELLERDGFVARVFTERERAYCGRRSEPAVHFAGTLAAKEAVIKALRLGPLPAWARRIEIVRRAGVPVATVTRSSGTVEVEVSISHDAGVAMAAALAPVTSGKA